MVTAGETEADPAGVERLVDVERYGVLIHRDARAVERLFRFLAFHALREHVHQHQVRVGASRDYAEARIHQALRQGARVGHHLLLVLHESRLHGFQETHRLGCHHVHQRSALHSGKDHFVDGRAELLLRQNEPGARPTQGLMRGRGYDVRVLAGIGMQTGCHQPGDVGHIDEEDCAHGVGDLAKAREVDDARIGAGARDNHLGLVFLRQPLHFVVIDALVFLAYVVGHHLVRLAREVQRVAVGQVPAVGEVEPHDGIAGSERTEAYAAWLACRARKCGCTLTYSAPKSFLARSRARFSTTSVNSHPP